MLDEPGNGPGVFGAPPIQSGGVISFEGCSAPPSVFDTSDTYQGSTLDLSNFGSAMLTGFGSAALSDPGVSSGSGAAEEPPAAADDASQDGDADQAAGNDADDDNVYVFLV